MGGYIGIYRLLEGNGFLFRWNAPVMAKFSGFNRVDTV
jgi:hypothetical protein